jgi:hypothetical protein
MPYGFAQKTPFAQKLATLHKKANLPDESRLSLLYIRRPDQDKSRPGQTA